ncbi:hypothetical protein [Lacisediminihabitans profunda]|uniref:Lipoprotein n=1 Tax=Lacisediminihabitans profunda TaxID=2594790 RepID=A0A5C8UV66_9MICO|nr:hypothetical protein [Lacisediminihabitans profunda]TXN31498.1 hypothetical protein FVP33_08135 [Lacisediminihabitans profunda]
MTGRRRARLGPLVAAALVAALLAGCAPAAARSPVSAADLHRVRQTYIDAAWAGVTHGHPEALRPRVPVTKVVSDWNWLRSRVGCLRAAGLKATLSGDGSSYSLSSTVGQTTLEVAITNYNCAAQFAPVSTFSSGLPQNDYRSLRSYFVGFVRPCLLASGLPSPAPPGRAAFISGDSQGRFWNPYEQVWLGGLPDATIDYFEQRCPPVPSWLALTR